MAFFRRIRGWFTGQGQTTIPQAVILADLLEKARREQYNENYQAALNILDEAFLIAKKEDNARSMVDIRLSRADIFVTTNAFESAEVILKELKAESESRQMRAPLAYTLASWGALEQKRDKWAEAQKLYESSRKIAIGIKTDGAVGRSTAHLADVYLHDGNANYALYLLEEALPRLDKSGDRELLAYFQGLLGTAYLQSGNAEQGLKALQRGLETANNLKHRGQMRFLNLLLGEEYLCLGNYRQAQQNFLDALNLFPEPAPETLEYGSLLCQIAKSQLRLGERNSVKNYAEKALRIAEKLEAHHLALQAKACLGLVMDDENTLNYLQEAARAYESLEKDSFYIEILRRMASLQEGALAEESFQKAALAVADDILLTAQVQSDLANFYVKQKRLREAISAWQAAAKLYQEANQAGHVARIYCEVGALYEQLGDGRMALRDYSAALEQLGRLDDLTTKGLVLANVAAAYSEFGDVESAQDFFKEAIEIAQRSQNLKAESLRRANYGRLLALTNRTKQALAQFEQARRNNGADLQNAVLIGNEALAYTLQEDFSLARERYHEASRQLELINAANWQAINYANLGDMRLRQGQTAEAKAEYEKALDLAKRESLVAVLVQATLGLVEIALIEQDLSSAQSLLSEIDPITKRLFYKRFLALLYQAWSKLYALQGKKKEAEIAWEEAKKFRSMMRMMPINADWL